MARTKAQAGLVSLQYLKPKNQTIYLLHQCFPMSLEGSGGHDLSSVIRFNEDNSILNYRMHKEFTHLNIEIFHSVDERVLVLDALQPVIELAWRDAMLIGRFLGA